MLVFQVRGEPRWEQRFGNTRECGVGRARRRPETARSAEPREQCSPLNQSQAEAWARTGGDSRISVETDGSQEEVAP